MSRWSAVLLIFWPTRNCWVLCQLPTISWSWGRFLPFRSEFSRPRYSFTRNQGCNLSVQLYGILCQWKFRRKLPKSRGKIWKKSTSCWKSLTRRSNRSTRWREGELSIMGWLSIRINKQLGKKLLQIYRRMFKRKLIKMWKLRVIRSKRKIVGKMSSWINCRISIKF